MLDKQVETSEPERDEQGRLLPGNTANPNGRPKRKTLTELIHAKLDDTPEAWEAIVAMVIQKLLKDKNDQVLKAFWEYTDGKPTQRTELTGKDGKDLPTPILSTHAISTDNSDKKASSTD